MSRFLFLFLIILGCACSEIPPHAVLISGRVASPEDTVYLYTQIGLERLVAHEIPLSATGDSFLIDHRIDSVDKGWYYLGLAPNSLTTVLMVPGETVEISGVVGNAGLFLKPPSAQSRWGEAARQFVIKQSAVEAASKVAMTNYNNGEVAAYADYSNLARMEYEGLLSWVDSLAETDPYLAIEYELRLIPPYLPEYGAFDNEDAFIQQDAYWRALLKRHGETVADFPGFVSAFETWMDLQYREEAWATPALRAARAKELINQEEEGSLLHQNLLAATVSVLDGWRDLELIWFAEEYLRLYPGNRRMASFLEARIRMMKDLKRDENEPVSFPGGRD